MLENALKNFNQKQFDEIKSSFIRRDYKEVIELSVKYLVKDSKNAWANAYLGLSLWYISGTQEKVLSAEYLKKALDISPNDPNLYANIGLIYLDNKSSSSIQYFQKALELDGKCALAYYGLGVAYFSLGEIEAGIDLILKAISLENNLKFLEDLNHYIYYDPRFKNPEYKQIAELYSKVAKTKYNIKPHTHEKSRYEANKKNLRIGLFNAENVNTPTWPFLERIIKYFDKEKFSFFCYLKPPRKADTVNEHPYLIQIKKLVEKAVYCDQMSAEEIAEQIHNDEIDILIDLSGYLPSIYSFNSVEPAINVFLYRPAPVQITWYGFWGTTGIEEIDYLITSEENAALSQNEHFTEKIYRLPKGYTHAEILHDLPEIDPMHAFEKNGYITFTSFSRITKLNQHVFNLWAEILKRAEGSKFLIKYHFLEVELVENFIRTNFKKRGIDPDRILIEAKRTPAKEFVAKYNEVDIALEPVPFGGVTTTINALTMGIPVICKSEENRIGCGGSVSILKAINCEELAARTDEDYINRAVELSKNFEKLREYKKTLRGKIAQSSITAAEYSKDLAQAFIDIWHDCCTTKNPQST